MTRTSTGDRRVPRAVGSNSPGGETAATNVLPGLLLFGVTAAALLWANSFAAPLYEWVLSRPLTIQLGDLALSKPLLLWVNDGLMAVFFLVVGLEIKREVLEGMDLKSNRFGFEPEITAKIARKRLDGKRVRVYEVPISYYGRDYADGKKIGWKDGVAAIWHILRYNLFS